MAMVTNLGSLSDEPKRLAVGLEWNDVPKIRLGEEDKLGAPHRPGGLAGGRRETKAAPRRNAFYRFMDVFANLFSGEIRKKEDKAGRDIKFKKRDLDLHCFIFNADKKLVCEVSPDPEKLIDPSSSVYHSGDDFSGEGAFDDETIKLELNRLSNDYVHFFFVVTCDTKLTFAQCGEFRLHLYDPQTNKDILLKKARAEKGTDHGSYVFCHLQKGDTWDAKPVEEFGPFDRNWASELAAFIR